MENKALTICASSDQIQIFPFGGKVRQKWCVAPQLCLELCSIYATETPPKKGARIPQPCSSSTVPTPSIFTSVQPSQSSNLEISPSIPIQIPPSTHLWMLNLLQQTQSSNFLHTHADRVAVSDDLAYAVLHQPFSSTLASIDIASLQPHVGQW